MQEAYAGLAEVYDAWMQDVDYDAWADDIALRLRAAERSVQAVLECACGTGALTTRLRRKGYDVMGMDCAVDMLQIAQKKAREQGLRIPFVQQDMREIALHRRVDAIVCACDGVNYLHTAEDVCAFFTAAHKALHPGGLLLFDISSRYKLQHTLADNTFAETLEDCAYLWQNSYDEQTALCEMAFTGFVRRGALYERFDELHIQRGHSIAELTAWLCDCGFADIAAYEAFTMIPPAATAERIQFCAKAIV